jgi:hypothetical protein
MKLLISNGHLIDPAVRMAALYLATGGSMGAT